MTTESSPATWRDWCQLVRLPNVFTVLADTTAAFLLVAGNLDPLGRYVMVVASVVCLYWAGMVLNDVWDIEVDRQQRSSRPLASGRIKLSTARRAGFALLFSGVGLAVGSGFLPTAELSANVVPGAIGLLLATAIVLYDGPVKRTPLAPLMMGTCRFFSFLLGASAALLTSGSPPFFDLHVIAIAAGLGIYIVGVTIMAREEAIGGNRKLLIAGLIVVILGLLAIAGGPRLAPPETHFFLHPTSHFPWLIGLLALTVIHRGVRAINHPEPRTIQMTIKHAILSLIPLAAAIAFLGAGSTAAIFIFALVVPAMTLGSFLRVT